MKKFLSIIFILPILFSCSKKDSDSPEIEKHAQNSEKPYVPAVDSEEDEDKVTSTNNDSSNGLVSPFWKEWRNKGALYKDGIIYLDSRFGLTAEFHTMPIWSVELPKTILVYSGEIKDETKIIIELYTHQCVYKKKDKTIFEIDNCDGRSLEKGPARMQCIEMQIVGQDDLEIRGEFKMIQYPDKEYNL